ncbi:ClpA/ClpB-like protein [Nonomuraea polychroma]|uniref:ClpA/ClpB-like protein n=1 Tax=Nonomuraea polychroma TaxID=46176 RepID=A0A438LZ15_9ACTN|nr:Clp protease N-terminal domain-containing protein [Nonomuraea polychroma]RVX38779.1 ClpA/ClpB-like protein [Nonomuraea polychroma]
MFEEFAEDTRAVIDSALVEVGQRGDQRLGTEHLLLGLLHVPVSPWARALGVSLATARRTLDEIDRSALAVIQIDISRVRLGGTPPPATKGIPWTYAARGVIKHAAEEMVHRRGRSLEPKHILLGILESRRPDLASAVLDQLAVDRTAVRNRLR